MNIIKDKFHSFDALRFFSFLIVFISHLPLDLFPNSSLNILKNRGYVGVYFFFTLSGFLITYILLNEKKNSFQINVKKFFVRRALRIWPLYYLMILFAFVSPYIINFLGLSYSSEGYEPNYFISCLFLENYRTLILNEFPNVMPLPVFWSLCVEEHFYIIWGGLLYFSKINKVPYLIVIFLIIPSIARYFFLENNLLFLDLTTNIDFFMFGAIPAYLYVKNKEKLILKIMNVSKYLKYLILITTVLFVLFIGNYNTFKEFALIEPVALGILYSLTLFIFLPSENNFKVNDKNLISKLGIYTYGLYLTHIIIIRFFYKLALKFSFNLENHFWLFFIISLFATIIASYFSYNYLEKPFLKLKEHFK